MEPLTITFIGAGNMAASMIGGLIADGCDPRRIRASDPDAAALASLAERYGIAACASNSEAVSGAPAAAQTQAAAAQAEAAAGAETAEAKAEAAAVAETAEAKAEAAAVAETAQAVILAVKPQVMAAAAREIAPAVAAAGAVAISIAAGITLAGLEKNLGENAAIVRCMPNTPALLRQGATAMFANARATPAQRRHAEAILGAVGDVCWVPEEKLLDAVTALSGSGPAYFFYLLEAMIAAGESLGLSPQISRRLALQTGVGAARMAMESDAGPGELRRRVSSPGGTTERAIETFQNAGFEGIVRNALHAAAERADELGREAV